MWPCLLAVSLAATIVQHRVCSQVLHGMKSDSDSANQRPQRGDPQIPATERQPTRCQVLASLRPGFLRGSTRAPSLDARHYPGTQSRKCERGESKEDGKADVEAVSVARISLMFCQIHNRSKYLHKVASSLWPLVYVHKPKMMPNPISIICTPPLGRIDNVALKRWALFTVE